jgi:hypothetical protein
LTTTFSIQEANDANLAEAREEGRRPVKTYSRRTVLAAGAVGVFAATVGAKIAGVGPFSEGGAVTGCYWGIGAVPDIDPDFWSYATSLEGKLGRKFAAFRFDSTTNLTPYNQGYDQGWHWTYVNGKPKPASGSYSGYWRATANGTYDSHWNTYFQTVKANPRWAQDRPIHFSFHHEQSIAAEGGGLGNGSPADFIAAFRHVRGLMDTNHAHVSQGGNMQMCWSPHWLQIAKTANPFYKCNPGASYYDLLGCDIYNTTSATYTAVAQWKPVHDYAVSLGKPFFTGEQGVAGSDTKVLKYLQDLDVLLKSYGAGTAAGNIAALNFTTRIASGGDYRMDATPTILAQYRSMAQDSFYNATQ